MKTFTNCAEKMAKQILNLLQGYTKGIRMTAILVLLLMGVSNAWSWNTLYLASSHNDWNSNTYGLRNSSTGTGVFYSYTPVDMDFKIIHARTTWLGRDYGDKLKPGDGGFNFDKNKSSNCRYNGDAGIVGFNCNQKDHADDWPWIWLTRPTIKIKHWWGGSDNNWTAYNMEDNQNGTYSYIGYYSGYNQTNIGIEGSDATLKYIENAKLEGLNENTGNKKCLFTYNSNGYIGHGTASQNTGSLTITRLYTIKYDGNGSTTGVPSDHDKKHGTNTTLSSSIPTRTGYTFAGWNTKQDGTGNTYAKGATYSTNADVTLYAKWTANTYTVTFSKQSGTGGTASVTATYGSAMPAITKPTRNGYTFGGYYTAINGGGTQYYNANGASAKNWAIASNSTLCAKWTANQSTITWNANGGSVTPASSTYTYDGDPVALPTPTRTGYEFNGWFTASTGGTRISDVGKTNKPTSNTTYYAQWKAKTYIVTLDPQGGFSGSNSINATYDATLPAITPPTRDGYMFNGYYSQPSGKGDKYYNADGTSARTWNQENATLYAYWVDYSKCIFFKNTLGWENVFIYTFSNNAWWETGIEGVHPKANNIEHGQMSRLGETDIYYYILTHTTTPFNHIAFSDVNMSSWNEFNKNEACYRGDRTDKMPLFVPYKGVNKIVNDTKYYNEGVWMKYNSKESGYYLNISGESSTPLVAANAGDYTFTAIVYLTPGQRILDLTNLYPNTKFSKDGSLTSGTSLILDKWQKYSADSKLSLSTTNEGAYPFT